MADGFGYNDMMKMQSEAVQRVREMQRRAQNAVQKANAQRTGRAQEQAESKGDSFKHSAQPLTQSAKTTALPLDYIGKQSPARPNLKSDCKATPDEEKTEQSVEEKATETTSRSALSDNLDKLLVVALILLLSQEEADELLLMALGYLIM